MHLLCGSAGTGFGISCHALLAGKAGTACKVSCGLPAVLGRLSVAPLATNPTVSPAVCVCAVQAPAMCVAEIMSVSPHPKADRLRVVQARGAPMCMPGSQTDAS